MASASRAEILSPSSIISMSLRRETTRRSTAMIIIGKSPRWISGVPRTALSHAIAKSHDATIPRPPPIATPGTRAIVGFPSVVKRSSRST